MNVDTSSAFKIIYSGVLLTRNANLSQSQYVGFRWIRKIIVTNWCRIQHSLSRALTLSLYSPSPRTHKILVHLLILTDPYFHASGYLYYKELWCVLQLTLPAPCMQKESTDFAKAHSGFRARKPSYECHTSESLSVHQGNLLKTNWWKEYLVNTQQGNFVMAIFIDMGKSSLTISLYVCFLVQNPFSFFFFF